MLPYDLALQTHHRTQQSRRIIAFTGTSDGLRQPWNLHYVRLKQFHVPSISDLVSPFVATFSWTDTWLGAKPKPKPGADDELNLHTTQQEITLSPNP